MNFTVLNPPHQDRLKGIMEIQIILDSFVRLLSYQDSVDLHAGDVVVGLLHALMVHFGFRLPADITQEWNSNKDFYTFQYRHEQSAMTFILRFVRASQNVFIVSASTEEEPDKIHSLQLPSIQDILSCSTTITLLTKDIEMAKTILSSCIKSSALSGLLTQFHKEIIQKLVPDIQKPGFQHLTSSTSTQTTTSQDRQQRNIHDPLRMPHHRSYVQRPEFPYSSNHPYNIGDVDLDPFSAAPGIMRPG